MEQPLEKPANQSGSRDLPITGWGTSERGERSRPMARRSKTPSSLHLQCVTFLLLCVNVFIIYVFVFLCNIFNLIRKQLYGIRIHRMFIHKHTTERTYDQYLSITHMVYSTVHIKKGKKKLYEQGEKFSIAAKKESKGRC